MNPAQQLAHMRWSNMTPEERAQDSADKQTARMKLSKRRRSEIARIGGIARAIKAGQRLGQLGIILAVILWGAS